MVPGFVLLALCAGGRARAPSHAAARAPLPPRLLQCADARCAMTGIHVGFVIFGVMLALMVVRVPIGIAMFAVGAGGYLYLTGGASPRCSRR